MHATLPEIMEYEIWDRKKGSRKMENESRRILYWIVSCCIFFDGQSGYDERLDHVITPHKGKTNQLLNEFRFNYTKQRILPFVFFIH